MALTHAEPGDIIEVKPLGAALVAAKSHALFKSADLEVIRLVLKSGERMPPHAVAGEFTLQCLEGRIAFECASGERELATGQMTYLAGNELHALRGIDDASLLLTITLKNKLGA